ncbi:hypothetical protein HaLaN_01497 [Haematococcus lacustris]|uniref:Uncharacterized protein n=1 Tax=Haematococcus lacustris TaxID=44745 RepID=A0A699YLC5_HAELA|nr:hypothetical protein HaLaN_01497 [Haematococcus lacustris]
MLLGLGGPPQSSLSPCGCSAAAVTSGGPGVPGLSAGGGTHRRGLVALGSKPVLPAAVSEDLSELSEAARAALAQLAAVLDPGGEATGRSSSPPSHAPAPTPPATNGGEQQEVAQEAQLEAWLQT